MRTNTRQISKRWPNANAALIQFELEHVDYAILELLQRSRKLYPTAVALLGKNGGRLWEEQLMTIEPTLYRDSSGAA